MRLGSCGEVEGLRGELGCEVEDVAETCGGGEVED